MKILLIILAFTLSACTPTQVGHWLDLHGIETTSARNQALADVLDDPPGWVDLGHGIWGPVILVKIRQCESGGSYTVKNPSSSARGAYQFLTSSWAGYGHEARYGVPVASMALPWQQDEAAVLTMMRSGTAPWNPSKHCWG